MGGHINNYLLEKSRVIAQQAGDNNFHAFYQLIKGAPQGTLDKLYLSKDFNSYRYLKGSGGGGAKVQLPQKVRRSIRVCMIIPS